MSTKHPTGRGTDAANDHAMNPQPTLGIVERLKRRIKAACRTNEPQATTAVALSVIMTLACYQKCPGISWVALVSIFMFWPTLAFILNLIDPLPVPEFDGPGWTAENNPIDRK